MNEVKSFRANGNFGPRTTDIFVSLKWVGRGYVKMNLKTCFRGYLLYKRPLIVTPLQKSPSGNLCEVLNVLAKLHITSTRLQYSQQVINTPHSVLAAPTLHFQCCHFLYFSTFFFPNRTVAILAVSYEVWTLWQKGVFQQGGV